MSSSRKVDGFGSGWIQLIYLDKSFLFFYLHLSFVRPQLVVWIHATIFFRSIFPIDIRPKSVNDAHDSSMLGQFLLSVLNYLVPSAKVFSTRHSFIELQWENCVLDFSSSGKHFGIAFLFYKFCFNFNSNESNYFWSLSTSATWRW